MPPGTEVTAVDVAAIPGGIETPTIPHLPTTLGLRGKVSRARPIVARTGGLVEEAARTGDPVEEAAGGTVGPGVVHEVPLLDLRPIVFAHLLPPTAVTITKNSLE